MKTKPSSETEQSQKDFSMGKFSDALEKAKKSGEEYSRKATVKRLAGKAKHAPRRIDALKLEMNLPKVQQSIGDHSMEKLDSHLVTILNPNTPASDCFRRLRAKLLFNNQPNFCRTIMICSAESLDGKSIVATNLAVSIAHGINEHVLLVDCDLRRPSLHRILNLDAPMGLSTYLMNGNSVSPYLLKTPVEKLTLLPAGEPPPNPSELLSCNKMKHLIKELKERYKDRFIIFDTPPAYFTPEGSSLASMVEGVLLVVRSGKTSYKRLVSVVNAIGREKILGVAFNHCNEILSDYGQYYHYYQKKV